MFNLTISILLCPLAGATLKLADMISETKDNTILGFLVSSMSGILIGSLMTFDRFTSAVFSGIVVGVLLAGKVDRPCLGFGLIVTSLTAWLIGPKTPVLVPLLITSLASFADEIGHDKYSQENSAIGKFLRYRCILKLTVLLSGLLGTIPLHSLGMFFLFDLAYDLFPSVLGAQG